MSGRLTLSKASDHQPRVATAPRLRVFCLSAIGCSQGLQRLACRVFRSPVVHTGLAACAMPFKGAHVPCLVLSLTLKPTLQLSLAPDQRCRRSWAHEQLGRRERAAADQMVVTELVDDVSADQRDKSRTLLAKMRRRMPASALNTVRRGRPSGARPAWGSHAVSAVAHRTLSVSILTAVKWCKQSASLAERSLRAVRSVNDRQGNYDTPEAYQ